MDIRQIAEGVSVVGQITPDDVPVIAAHGFKAIICNRPDGEAADQPLYSAVAGAAKTAGLEIRYIPIVPGQAGAAEVDASAKALEELPRPLLAYCRSGARSTTMYQAAMAKTGS